MRLITLLLPLALVVAAASTVLGGEDDLAFRTFHVDAITQVRELSRGPELGMRPIWLRTEDEWHEEEARAFVSGKLLVDLVREEIDPESWQDDGTMIQWRDGLLHVRNHPATMRKVDAYLYGLAMQAQARALVSVRVLESTGGDLHATPLDAELKDAASIEVPLGVRRFVQATNSIRYVTDYEVEIAQASNIANPIVRFGLEGLVADVIVRPMRDGDQLLVEALVQQGRYGEARQLELNIDEESFNQPYRSQDLRPIGTLDLPVFHHVDVHVSGIVRSGQTLAVPIVRNGRRLTLHIQAERRGPPAGGPVVDVSALTRLAMPNAWQLLTPAELRESCDREMFTAPLLRVRDEDMLARPFAQGEHLIEMMQLHVRPECWDVTAHLRLLSQDRLYVAADRDVQAQVRDFLAERERDALTQIVLDVQVLSVPTTAASEPSSWRPGATLPTLPEGAALLEAVRLPTLSGRSTSFASGTSTHYLADYDVEVAQEARIADPIPGRTFDGLVGQMRPRLAMDGRTVAVDLDLTILSSSIAAEPFVTGARFLGPIDRVQEESLSLRSTAHVPTNGSTVIDAGIDPADPTRRRIVVVRAERTTP